jgi:hypothetical protein
VCVHACSTVLGSNPSRGEIFHAHPDQSPRPTHPPIQWILDLSWQLKQLGCGADHPPPSSTKGVNVLGALPLPPLCACVIMSWGDLYFYVHILDSPFPSSVLDYKFLQFTFLPQGKGPYFTVTQVNLWNGYCEMSVLSWLHFPLHSILCPAGLLRMVILVLHFHIPVPFFFPHIPLTHTP